MALKSHCEIDGDGIFTVPFALEKENMDAFCGLVLEF